MNRPILIPLLLLSLSSCVSLGIDYEIPFLKIDAPATCFEQESGANNEHDNCMNEADTEIVVFRLILLSLTCNLLLTYKFAMMFLSYRTFDTQEFLFPHMFLITASVLVLPQVTCIVKKMDMYLRQVVLINLLAF